MVNRLDPWEHSIAWEGSIGEALFYFLGLGLLKGMGMEVSTDSGGEEERWATRFMDDFLSNIVMAFRNCSRSQWSPFFTYLSSSCNECDS